MTSGSYLSVLAAVEGLYESVVGDPSSWNDQALADWAGETLVDAAELPKEVAREVRRCLRAAQKLRTFWAEESSSVVDHDDWKARVDIALGPRAWRPTLNIATAGLHNAPSEELFAEVKERFAVVNSERWMDGIDYEDWLDNG